MKRIVTSIMLSLILIVGFVGCGGGGGSSSTPQSGNTQVYTGVFLDSAVEGLGYRTTSGLEGKTNKKGEFEYHEGDDIDFFVGDIQLGQVKAQEIITIYDLEYPLQVAQFLQTFDEDMIPDNGININEKTYDAMLSQNNAQASKVSNKRISKVLVDSVFEISQFDPESIETNKFVQNIVQIAVLPDREPISRYDALSHTLYALMEQQLAKDESPLLKYLYGDQYYDKGVNIPDVLNNSAKARVYLFVHQTIVDPMIDLEHELYKSNINDVDTVKTYLETAQTLASAVSDVNDIAESAKKASDLAFEKGAQLGTDLTFYANDTVVNSLIEDDVVHAGAYAGFSAMRNCAIGIATKGNYSNCIAEAVNSVQTLVFAAILNVDRVQDEELQIAQEYLNKLAGCGGQISCMSEQYLSGNSFSYENMINYIRNNDARFNGNNGLFTNDPNYKNIMRYIYKFDTVTKDYVKNIENLLGDLSKYDKGLDNINYAQIDVSNIVIKEYEDGQADISYELKIEDKGAGVIVKNIKVELQHEKFNAPIILHNDSYNLSLRPRAIKHLNLGNQIPSWNMIRDLDSIQLNIEISYIHSSSGEENTGGITTHIDIPYVLSEFKNNADLTIYLEPNDIQVMEREYVKFVAFESGLVDLPNVAEAATAITFEQIEGPSVNIQNGIGYDYSFRAPSIPDDKEKIFLTFKVSTQDIYTKVTAETFLKVIVLKAGELKEDEELEEIASGTSVRFNSLYMNIEPNIPYTFQAIVSNYYDLKYLDFVWDWDAESNEMEVLDIGDNGKITVKFNDLEQSTIQKYTIQVNVYDEYDNSSDNASLSLYLKSSVIVDEDEPIQCESGTHLVDNICVENDKFELSWIGQTNLLDTCINFIDENCAYSIQEIDKGSSVTTTWKLRNTGNVNLYNLSLQVIDDDTNLNISMPTFNKTSYAVSDYIEISTTISIPEDIVGEHNMRWKILTSEGETINFSNGNTAAIWLKINSTNDNTPNEVVDNIPTVQYNSTNNATYTENFSLSVTSTDDISLSQVVGLVYTSAGSYTGKNFSLNISGTSSSQNHTIDIVSLADGNYYVELASKDNADQESNRVKYYFTKESIVVDNIPTVQYNSTNNATYSENFSLSVTSTDDIGLVQVVGLVYTSVGSYTGKNFSLNISGTSSTQNHTIDIASLADGNYYVELASKDSTDQESNRVKYYFTKESANDNVTTVTGLDASDGLYENKITVSWEEDSSAISYKVFRCMNTSVNSCSELSDVATTTYDDLTALAASTYYYRIKAVGLNNTSDYSEYDAGTLSSAATLPVSNKPNASDGTYYNKIEISWDEILGVTAGANYELYRCTDTSTSSCVLISRRTNTSHTDEKTDGIQANKTYYYRVRIQGTGNEVGEFSNYDAGYLDPVEPVVTEPIASQGIFGDRVHVSWVHVSGASSYNIYACNTFGIFPEDVLSSSECRSVTSQTAYHGDTGDIYTEVYDTNVVPGDKYWYYVRAKKDGDYGEFSMWSNSGYAGLETPLVPTISTVVDVTTYGDPTPTLSLKPIPQGAHGAEYYKVYRCTTTQIESCVLVQDVLPYNFVYDNKISYNTDYYYRARSVSYSGNVSEFSNYAIGRSQ